MPIRLSKSRLLAFRQCERRLWLELHHPELRQDDDASVAAFAVGHQVGDLARSLYDPDGTGVLLDPQAEGFDAALARTRALLASTQPVFEAGFAAAGALAFADILLPVDRAGQRRWRMVEVKSSTSVKDYYHDDAAIQAYVAQAAGLPLDGIAVAHIDSGWVYPGGGDYRGLLVEHDLTDSAFARGPEVAGWIARAQAVAGFVHEPGVRPGGHCNRPYACGFSAHCRGGGAQAEYPVEWLPKQGSRAFRERLANGAADMRDVEDGLLNAKQLRVKHHTLSNGTYFDAAGAAADLAPWGLPAWFIDFETISFTVPVWKGTSPYQKIPFQFSVHRLGAAGEFTHEAFLDLSGDDPSLAFATALVRACGSGGPVFVYNAAFETGRIAELAARFPYLSRELLAISERVVDLLPVARERYYHPGQQGSWSIKRVLPAVAPDLRYDALDGVQDGGAAMQAYAEAIKPETPPARRQQIERQLLDYCHLDTLAMVRLWQFFSGQQAVPASPAIPAASLNLYRKHPMSNLNWYKPLEPCATLDDIRAQWRDLLGQNQMGPYNPTPGYHDAMLSFLGSCTLSAELKLAAVLALGSAFDFDFRLALGALEEQTMEQDVPWPESVSASVSDNGPALRVATGDAWLGAFIAGRMAGLRETFSHDGTRPDDWQAAFWNAFLEMACRHAAQDAVRLALQHGADPCADDYLAVSAAARGMHHENFEFRNYGLQDASNGDYGNTLLQLVEAGLPAREMLAVALRAAAEVDNTAMLDFLLAQGADIHADGGCALAAAARHLASGGFGWLLEHGADIRGHGTAVLDAAVATLTGHMVDEVLAAGADLLACANEVFRTALNASPYDLYPEMDDVAGRRADMITLLLRHGARPAGPGAVDALRRAPDGQHVIGAVLEADALDASSLQLMHALAGQAFGQPA